MDSSVGANAGNGAIPPGPVGPNYPPHVAAEAPPAPQPSDDQFFAEIGQFAQAIAGSASAELSLSLAAASRTMTHGFIALFAGFIGWSFGLVAAVLALADWLDSAAWSFTIVAAVHVIVGAYAWKRRLLWQRRIGFARTKAALSTALGMRTPPT